MARIKTFVGTRKPDATGSVKTIRKTGPGLASKGILKKPSAQESSVLKKKKKKSVVIATAAAPEIKQKKTPPPAAARKKKQRAVEEKDEEAPASDEDEDAAEVEEAQTHVDDDEVVSTDDEEEEEAGAAASSSSSKTRKINYALRRLKRMKTLQKSDARLCTEAGFRKLVRFILYNSTTAPMGLDTVRFTRAALQNLQAAVESLLQLILTDTAQQVYTITGRNARISAAPIATTAEQRLRGMNGAQFINDYRDVCNM